MSSPPAGEWSSPRVTGQPPPPCHDSSLSLQWVRGELHCLVVALDHRAVSDDLLIVELTKHTVVSV